MLLFIDKKKHIHINLCFTMLDFFILYEVWVHVCVEKFWMVLTTLKSVFKG